MSGNHTKLVAYSWLIDKDIYAWCTIFTVEHIHLVSSPDLRTEIWSLLYLLPLTNELEMWLTVITYMGCKNRVGCPPSSAAGSYLSRTCLALNRQWENSFNVICDVKGNLNQFNRLTVASVQSELLVNTRLVFQIFMF